MAPIEESLDEKKTQEAFAYAQEIILGK